jgi:hypothetical protein
MNRLENVSSYQNYQNPMKESKTIASAPSDMQQNSLPTQGNGPKSKIHYNKLKITYFRKLNLLPILSPSEAEEVIDEIVTDLPSGLRVLSNPPEVPPHLQKYQRHPPDKDSKQSPYRYGRAQSSPISIPLSSLSSNNPSYSVTNSVMSMNQSFVSPSLLPRKSSFVESKHQSSSNGQREPDPTEEIDDGVFSCELEL